MTLTPLQEELARHLRSAVAAVGCRRVVYRSEWLGYLPFGLDHWATIGDEDVSVRWPQGWDRDDLDALTRAGVLVSVSICVNPQDSCEVEAQYDVAHPPAESGAAAGRPGG